MQKIAKTVAAALLATATLAGAPAAAAAPAANLATEYAQPTTLKVGGGYFNHGSNGLRYGRDGHGQKHHGYFRGGRPHGGAYYKRHRRHSHFGKKHSHAYGKHAHGHRSKRKGLFFKVK